MPSDHDHYDDEALRHTLSRVKTIAVVGASADPARASFGVIHYLLRRGYRVFGVNPTLDRDAIPGIVTVPSVTDLPEPVDMVDVFRNNAAIPGVVDAVLAMAPRPWAIWMQLGVRVDAAAAKAEGAGLTVVMDRCPKIEIPRLFGIA